MTSLTSGYALNSAGGIRAFDEAAPIQSDETAYPDYATALAAVPSKIRTQSATLAQIATLEASITNRMWREAQLASTTVMACGADDPRTGRTAAQYIAWVDGQIAALRAQLGK